VGLLQKRDLFLRTQLTSSECACACACAYACACACVCARSYAYARVYTHARAHVYVFAHTYMCTSELEYKNIRVRRASLYAFTLTHTYIDLHIYYTYAHNYTHIQSNLHTKPKNFTILTRNTSTSPPPKHTCVQTHPQENIKRPHINADIPRYSTVQIILHTQAQRVHFLPFQQV